MGDLNVTKQKTSEIEESPRGPTPPAQSPLYKHVKLKWKDPDGRGHEWIATTVPDGEKSPARIRQSSLNSDGSRDYFCYRNGTAVAIKKDLERAKDACERGPNPKYSDNVLAYVEKHPLDVPWWLKLTEGERRAVRAQYPYAAPSQSAVSRLSQPRGRNTAADPSDPGTRRLLDELARAEGASGHRQPATVRKAKKAALSDPRARLGRVPGMENPGRPGTKRHAGYAIILGVADRRGTIAEALEAGANELRLAKCIAKAFVELLPPDSGAAAPAPAKATPKSAEPAERPSKKGAVKKTTKKGKKR